jgi:hypothetical protein
LRKFFIGKHVRSTNSCYGVCRDILKYKWIMAHKEIVLHSAANWRGAAVLKREEDYKFAKN